MVRLRCGISTLRMLISEREHGIGIILEQIEIFYTAINAGRPWTTGHSDGNTTGTIPEDLLDFD
jgi:hypothetical protein